MSAREWEALCVRAAAWIDLGPERYEASSPREWEMAMRWFESRDRSVPQVQQFAGLALFAWLMAVLCGGVA